MSPPAGGLSAVRCCLIHHSKFYLKINKYQITPLDSNIKYERLCKCDVGGVIIKLQSDLDILLPLIDLNSHPGVPAALQDNKRLSFSGCPPSELLSQNKF